MEGVRGMEWEWGKGVLRTESTQDLRQDTVGPEHDQISHLASEHLGIYSDCLGIFGKGFRVLQSMSRSGMLFTLISTPSTF